MKDVAQEAGVSVATVSRVINGSGSVSNKLERKVQRAIKKLHYHPSTIARSFKTQKSMSVGILIPVLDHPGYSRMTSIVEKKLMASGYHGIICSSEENESQENDYIEMLLRQRVDGMIINSAARHPKYLSELQENNIPIVLFDRGIQGVSCHQVYCDNSRGGYEGIQHLYELGHYRIGVIGGPKYPEVMKRRIEGTQQAKRDYQLDVDPNLLITVETQSFETGYSATRRLLQLNPRPTAIFTLMDVAAVGAMHAADEMGVKIPDELSVVGYDDLPIANYMLPPLTTIAQPFTEMGELAVSLLLDGIGNPELDPQEIILSTKLIVRKTTARMRS